MLLNRTAARLILLSWTLGCPRAALADVAACVQAHTSGQREAKAGRLKAAAEQFASCVSQDCPATIRGECAEFHKNTERSMPTVIFAALDEQGGDLIQVRVSADDQVLTETLDGRPIAVDPGQHHFKFELPSGQVLESDVVVREAEKNRIVSMRERPAPIPTNAASASGGSSPGLPSSFWVASGFGAAALVSFGAFAALGHGKQSTLNECAPNCSASSRVDYDAMHRDYLIADLSLGVAVVSAGVATWLLLRNDGSSASEPHAAASPPLRFTLTPLVSTRGVALELDARAF